MANTIIKYYKIVNGGYIVVNAADYRMAYYCGKVHWLNIYTGLEEDIYIDKSNYTFKQNTMEVETLVLVINDDNQREWNEISFNINDVKGYYNISDYRTRIILGTGEYEIKMPYKEFKRLKDISYTQSSILQFN